MESVECPISLYSNYAEELDAFRALWLNRGETHYVDDIAVKNRLSELRLSLLQWLQVLLSQQGDFSLQSTIRTPDLRVLCMKVIDVLLSMHVDSVVQRGQFKTINEFTEDDFLKLCSISFDMSMSVG